jgi:hypothetical protein
MAADGVDVLRLRVALEQFEEFAPRLFPPASSQNTEALRRLRHNPFERLQHSAPASCH